MEFTEEELTKMALLKAEAQKKYKNNIDQTTGQTTTQNTTQNTDREEQVIDQVQKSTVPETDPETGNNLVNFKELKLGSKTIHYSFWTGKTKKIFNDLMDKVSDDDLYKLTELLIREYIQEKDIYLSPIEEQYIIIKLRESSLTKDFTFLSTCPECGHDQEINTDTGIIKFVPPKYPTEYKDFTFVDIESYSEYRKNLDIYKKSPEYDPLTSEGDCEYAMHISKPGQSFIDILGLMDSLPLKDTEELISELKKCFPDLEIKTKEICKECNKLVEFETDEIPNLFEELI